MMLTANLKLHDWRGLGFDHAASRTPTPGDRLVARQVGALALIFDVILHVIF